MAVKTSDLSPSDTQSDVVPCRLLREGPWSFSSDYTSLCLYVRFLLLFIPIAHFTLHECYLKDKEFGGLQQLPSYLSKRAQTHSEIICKCMLTHCDTYNIGPPLFWQKESSRADCVPSGDTRDSRSRTEALSLNVRDDKGANCNINIHGDRHVHDTSFCICILS